MVSDVTRRMVAGSSDRWLGQISTEVVTREVVPDGVLTDGGRDLGDPADRLEAVADILSHDLLNHLTVAEGYLGLARESGDEADIEQVHGALTRIEELVTEVVYLARTGELVEDTEIVELQAIAERAWEAVPTHDATLVIEDSTRLVANRQALQHLLENLFHNAVVHAGPTVTVRVRITDSGFCVGDDGPGIPEDRWERVFESGRRSGGEGAGLGLTIADRIAAAHGWTMSVVDGEQGGACFKVEGVTEG